MGFRRTTLPVVVEYTTRNGDHREPATTLGARGLFVHTHDPLAEGSELRLRFSLPESGVVHELDGRVAWSLHDRGMSVEFTNRSATRALAKELRELP